MKTRSHLPILTLSRHLLKMGVQPAKLHHLTPWLLKFVLLQPLAWYESLRWNKQISTTPLPDNPVFILGHYRSGTTYLQRMLLCDDRFASPTVFEAALPELMLSFKGAIKPLLAAITRTLRAKNAFHQVPFDWDFPAEEDVAITAFGFRDALHWGNFHPAHLAHYFRQYMLFEGSPAKVKNWQRHYAYFLRKLTLQHSGKTLLLKSPPNTARIPYLLEQYPKARFIYIERDPQAVYASCKRFWALINRYYAFRPATAAQIHTLTIYSYRMMLEHYKTTRSLIPGGRLCEITYEELKTDPGATMAQIYHTLGLTALPSLKPRLAGFLKNTRNYAHQAYRLTEFEKTEIDKHWRQQTDPLLTRKTAAL